MNKTVLVSGGAGFIGSHVTVELLAAGYDVVVADNFSNCDETCFNGVKKITGREDLPLEKIDFCDEAAKALTKWPPRTKMLRMLRPVTSAPSRNEKTATFSMSGSLRMKFLTVTKSFSRGVVVVSPAPTQTNLPRKPYCSVPTGLQR